MSLNEMQEDGASEQDNESKVEGFGDVTCWLARKDVVGAAMVVDTLGIEVREDGRAQGIYELGRPSLSLSPNRHRRRCPSTTVVNETGQMSMRAFKAQASCLTGVIPRPSRDGRRKRPSLR